MNVVCKRLTSLSICSKINLNYEKKKNRYVTENAQALLLTVNDRRASFKNVFNIDDTKKNILTSRYLE